MVRNNMCFKNLKCNIIKFDSIVNYLLNELASYWDIRVVWQPNWVVKLFAHDQASTKTINCVMKTTEKLTAITQKDLRASEMFS